eukprot:888384-Amphidinium_carterae.1
MTDVIEQIVQVVQVVGIDEHIARKLSNTKFNSATERGANNLMEERFEVLHKDDTLVPLWSQQRPMMTPNIEHFGLLYKILATNSAAAAEAQSTPPPKEVKIDTTNLSQNQVGRKKLRSKKYLYVYQGSCLSKGLLGRACCSNTFWKRLEPTTSWYLGQRSRASQDEGEGTATQDTAHLQFHPCAYVILKAVRIQQKKMVKV